jgi:hypothetical protein
MMVMIMTMKRQQTFLHKETYIIILSLYCYNVVHIIRIPVNVYASSFIMLNSKVIQAIIYRNNAPLLLPYSFLWPLEMCLQVH